MSDKMKACANTDRELWRETEGDYYSPSIHVTEGGGIGIDVGGTVIVKPLREWHRAAIEATTVNGDGLVERVCEIIDAVPIPYDHHTHTGESCAFGDALEAAQAAVRQALVTPEAADTITTLKGEIERRDARIAELEALTRQTGVRVPVTFNDWTTLKSRLGNFAEFCERHADGTVISVHNLAQLADDVRQALGSTDNVG